MPPCPCRPGTWRIGRLRQVQGNIIETHCVTRENVSDPAACPALTGALTLNDNDVCNDGCEELDDIKAFTVDAASGKLAQ